jgi:hypothetical protein
MGHIHEHHEDIQLSAANSPPCEPNASKEIRSIHVIDAGLPVAQAKVFSFICHIYPDARASYGGIKFVAITHQTIAEKQKLSTEQVRRSLERLTEYGLIKVEHHRNHKGLRVCYIRPIIKTVAQLQAWKKPKASKARSMKSGQTGHVASSETGHVASSSIIPATWPVPKPATRPVCISITNSSEQSLEQGIVRVDAHASFFPKINEESLGENYSVEAKKDISPTVLYELWKSLLTEIGEYVPPMNGKMRGMFKQVITYWPIGRSANILSTVLGDWSGFTEYLVSDHGAFKLSKVPSLELITRYIGQVVTFEQRAANAAVSEAKTQAYIKQRDADREAASLLKAQADAAPKPSLSEVWGVPVPEGCQVQWFEDEIWITKNGCSYRTPGWTFAGMVYDEGLVGGKEKWKIMFPGNPVPETNPELYYRGENLAIIRAKIAEEKTLF